MKDSRVDYVTNLYPLIRPSVHKSGLRCHHRRGWITHPSEKLMLLLSVQLCRPMALGVRNSP